MQIMNAIEDRMTSQNLGLSAPERTASKIHKISWPMAWIIIIGLLLRLVYLGTKSLWLDEIWSVGTVQLSWHGFGYTLLKQDPNMSAYHALLRYWVLLGNSEWTMRMLSVLFGTATIPLVYALGCKLSSRFTGLCASLLLALNTFGVEWSQEIRSYSMVAFLVTASSLLFLDGLENSRTRVWLLYIAVSTLAAYCHLFAGLVILAQALALIVSPQAVTARWRALMSMAAIGMLSLPLLYLFYLRVRDPFIPMNWIPPLGPHDVVDVFHRLSGHAEIPGQKGGRLLLVATCSVCVLFAWNAWIMQGRKSRMGSRWQATFVLLWLFTPVLVLVALSLRSPILLPRYILISLPALMLVVAEGIRTVPRASWRWAVVVAFCALNGVELWHYYRFRAHETSWRDATASVLKESHAGDGAIFCAGPGRLLFRYYAEQMGQIDRTPESVYPEVRNEDDPTNLGYLPPVNEPDLEKALVGHNRVWIVLYQDAWPAAVPVRDHLEAETARQLTQMSEQRFGDVRVILYAKKTETRGL
jgi:hypothetical protein